MIPQMEKTKTPQEDEVKNETQVKGSVGNQPKCSKPMLQQKIQEIQESKIEEWKNLLMKFFEIGEIFNRRSKC